MEKISGVCNKYKVIIVGAGASGIAAAVRLISAGFGNDIVVLEGSNRIGGRINTKTFEGYTVELGAQWVHGEKDNIIYESVKKLNKNYLDDSSSDFYNVQCVLSNKELLSADVSTRLYQICEQIRESACDENNLGSLSFADYFIPRYNEFVDIELPDIPIYIRNGFLEWVHQFYNSIEGSNSWYSTSITSLIEYRECDGNSLIRWNQGGYKNVFKVISNSYDVNENILFSRVKFNKEVAEIKWNKDQNSGLGGQSKSNEKWSGIKVYCSDKSVYLADCIIVTSSLGVLKNNHVTLFQPKLPDRKLNAIKGLGFNVVDKIFIKFPYKWWPKSCPGFSLLWTKSDLDQFDFIQGENNWIKDIFGFYIVDSADNLLCGWVVGESAKMMEKQSDKAVLDVCYKLLNNFLSGVYNIPEPIAILRSKWYSEPLVLGSYSFRNLNTDQLRATHSQLAEPLVNGDGDKVIYFAGEATHPYYFSTVHGAIETGYREAEKTISDFNNKTPRSKL